MHKQPKQPKQPNGLILHESTSRVIIATLHSKNLKTGDMIQVWILPRSMSPLTAVTTGQDAVVCGSCPFRSNQGCYVNVARAPYRIWKEYQRGSYPVYNHREHKHLFAGREIRWGAYGDPVYIPRRIVNRLNRVVAGWTGYTHQWREPRYQIWRDTLMASVESPDDAREAVARGWRFYRVRPKGSWLIQGEIDCPSVTRGVHCVDCGLCDGKRPADRIGEDTRKSISIEVHGATVARALAKVEGVTLFNARGPWPGESYESYVSHGTASDLININTGGA